MNVEVRLSTYYGLFYLSIGSVMPFAALWLNTLGISPTFSGVIFAAPSIAIVLFTVFIGGWADRLSDWRTAIIVCNWVVLILFSWFLYQTGSWDILIVWTLAGLFTFASSPIMDAAALSLTKKRDSDYARIRAFGSIGFIVGVLLAGVFFDRLGYQWFVAILLIGVVARVGSAHALPHFRGHTQTIKDKTVNTSENPIAKNAFSPHSHLSPSATSGVGILMQPGILLVITGAALLNASHSVNNIFAVLHWTQSGISTNMASVLWSIGVIAEVALMWSFRSVARNFSARKCLMFAAVICVLRWFLTGTDPSLAQLCFLQCLHSITFGLSFLASVNFIAQRVHEDYAAQAQSVSATLVTLFMGIATWVSGWLYAVFAGQSYWAMAVMALIGGTCVLLSFASNLDDPVTAA